MPPSKKATRFTLRYSPKSPLQTQISQAIDDGAKVILACGGIRSGKSWGAIGEMLKTFYLRKKKPKLGWVISPTFTMMEAPETIFKELVYDRDTGANIVTAQQVAKRKYILKASPDAPSYPIEIQFKSATEPDRLRGSSVGFIVMDEGAMMSEETFNICLGRVMDNDGIILISTTPRGKNWLYHRVYTRSLSDPTYVTIRGRSDENTTLNPEFIRRKREELSNPNLIKQELEGEFTSFEGAVFPNFQPDTHIIAEPELQDSTPVYCGIDWGFNDPFVCVWVAYIDGVWVVLDEYYKTQTLLADHAAYLRNHPLASRVKRYWCDPSALQERREFQRMGIKTMPARKPDGNRSTSWPVMRARLMNTLFGKRVASPWDKTKSSPALVYSENCTNGSRETQSLSFLRFTEQLTEEPSGKVVGYRVTDKEGSALDKNATEEIEDRNNHFVDSLGYCMFSEERFQGVEMHYKDESGRPRFPTREKDPRKRAADSWANAFRKAERDLRKPPPEPFNTL